MPSPLRSRELEMHVIELVDLVLAGRRVEDDLIECKSEWPDPQKRAAARQLAGHANKARDEPILWIIGLDEKAHILTNPGAVEVADWWASMSSRFDPPAPELEHHLVVPVGERQTVTVLRFLTDRSPYVIMGGGENGALEREVPIRDGTRTRSARRDELLRLLLPAVAPPSAQLLSANLRASYSGGAGMALNQTTLSLGTTLFLQQPPLSTGVVMLPAHLMHAQLDFHGSIGSLRTELRYMTDEAVSRQRFSPWQEDQPIVVTTPTTLHGVSRRRDGVVVTGPGTLTVTAGMDLDGDLRSTLVASGLVQIRLSFGVAGVERRVNIDAQLDYAPKDKDERAVEWRFDVPHEAPWAEAAVSP